MRWIVAFGRFWYDLIVGDSVVLAIGGAAVLVFGFLLARVGSPALAEILLPLIVVATLAASLRT